MYASGVVLAAGAGVRLGVPKAELLIGGQRLLDRAVAALVQGGCDEVVVVIRAGVEFPLADSGAGSGVDAGSAVDVVTVVNPEPERGMSSSLRLALSTVRGDCALVMTVDCPGIGADAIRSVRDTPGEVVVATYGGARSHPVRIDRRYFPEVLALIHGDVGARAFLAANPGLVTELECPGDPRDLDTADDLAYWQSR